ncbi:hypothetical protein SLEP1_g43699 [Rubroshorea leprosula]|uniref:RING-type E3 ubiquitin transferase n=1 Tax=Rubroshorea leprosula TaxID=152421 RepID=A0AAV5LDU3_9ROSI|nr:hypothetical protein SLEP1_g43699 [Rubroshorea leprosula]
MDVQFRHRKLMSVPINKTLADFCFQNCNQSCSPSICWQSCSDFCISCGFPPPNHPSTKPHKFLIITFAVLATTLLALCFFVIYARCYSGRSGSRRRTRPQILEVRSIRDDFIDEDQGPVLDHPIWYIRTVGLPPAVISSIAVFKYKKGDGLVEGTECSVCLNEFQEDENLRLLPKCNHAFHIPCIDTWLTSHLNCPLCRAPIVSNTAIESSPEVNREELVTGEESQIGVLEENGESDQGEPEVGSSEVRVRTEEAEETPVQERGEASQPIRRSVSLDSIAASKIIREIANSGDQLVKERESRVVIVPRRLRRSRKFLRLMGSSSGRTLQIGPVSLKRSSSYIGTLPRCSKNHPIVRSL